MIKSLRLINFQGYSDSILEFDPLFNCIVGVGNAGKSSIIRALNLLLYNHWDKSWVTFGATHCTLVATLRNGIVLTRKKGLKINEYTVAYPDGNNQKFENFGTSVPDEIQKVWNIFAVELPGGDKIKLNLHCQFDSSFLQSITSSNKAKLFGKLSGLDILDAVNQEVGKDRKQAQTVTKTKEEELLLVEQKLLSFVGLPERRVEVDQIGSTLEIVHNQVLRLQALQTLKQKIDTWETTYKTLSASMSRYSSIDQVDTTVLENKVQSLKTRHTLKQRVSSWKNKQKELTQKTGNYVFVDLIDTEVLDNKVQNLKQRYNLMDKISTWKSKQSQLKNKVDNVEIQLSEASAQYTRELRESHCCPSCKQAITPECLMSIIGEL